MRYNKSRRNRFRNSGRGFGRSNYSDMRTDEINGFLSNGQRKPLNRNGQNPEKLIEKYNTLAQEASSNGDKILCESYYQYADHFIRINESRNSSQNNSKLNSDEASNEKKSETQETLDNHQGLQSEQKKNGEKI